MAQKTKFEKTLSNPFFLYMARLFWLIVVNFVFCLVSVCSLFVLFVPGLVSLHTIAYNMVHDMDKENPVITFFKEIKNQWMFNWRIELLAMAVIVVVGTLFYFDWLYLEYVAYDWFVWFSFIFVGVCFFVLLTVFINLMVYNNYIKNDTFKMMIKKSAVVTGKYIGKSIANVIYLLVFAFMIYLIPLLLPFVSFSLYIYLIEATNRKLYTRIAQEELERECLDENLFLPVKVEEDIKK
jgi:uncharacterized membrane protein YesL